MLDSTVTQHAPAAFSLLERLVAEPSVHGAEAGAQRVLAEALEPLGFELDWLELPDDIGDAAPAGVPSLPPAGRHVLVARLPGRDPSAGRSLVVNGHVDVVPAGERAQWRHDPFTAVREDGWLLGRGSGDMKGGWAMAVLAIEALLDASGRPAGDLTLVAAIEEENTGNGTLASVRAGVTADAALLPEPTDLQVLLSGVGVLWVEIAVEGHATHAEAADAGSNAIDHAYAVLGGLRELSDELNAGRRDGDPRYHVNVGTFHAGEWPSAVPGIARLGVRVGYPTALTPAEAEHKVRAAVAAASPPDLPPPDLRVNGFRAEGYSLPADAPLAQAIAAAHTAAHGIPPNAVGTNGTTDARFYLNQGGMPALCYGPRCRNMHGADEAVELQSIVDGARTLVRFLADWLGTP